MAYMKKIFAHYKFKSLRAMARMGVTMPLRYSLINHIGVLIAIASIFVPLWFADSFEEIVPFAAFLFILGLTIGGSYTRAIIYTFTIQER